MPLGKPDITKFDSDDDSIKDARPEIQTAFTSLNTMIDEYNANGDTFGSGLPPRTFYSVNPTVPTTYQFTGEFDVYDIASSEDVIFEIGSIPFGKVHYLAWKGDGTHNVKIAVNGTILENSLNDSNLKLRRLTAIEVDPDSYDSAGENYYILKEGLFPSGPYTR